MKIIVLADIHSEVEALSKVIRAAENDIKDCDLIICPGNLTDMSVNDSDFTQMDFANLIIVKLVGLNKPLFCVPGNHDPYDIITIFNEYGINLHNKHKTFNKMKFVGWGGALTPFNTLFEPTEKETTTYLTKLSKHVEKNNFIFVSHNPPKDTKLDKIQSGEHVGSPSIKQFITETQPLLCITAHIHEAVGEDVIGKTKLFNPGPIFDGNYGVVEITKTGVVCTRKNVRI